MFSFQRRGISDITKIWTKINLMRNRRSIFMYDNGFFAGRVEYRHGSRLISKDNEKTTMYSWKGPE